MFELVNVSDSSVSRSFDLVINYNRGVFTNLEASGDLRGGFEIINNGSMADLSGVSNFQITQVESNNSLMQGEKLAANYSVKNTGGIAGNQDIAYNISHLGASEASSNSHSSLSLNPGESSTVQVIQWQTLPAQAVGTYNIAISSDNDTVSNSFDILASPDPELFEVSITNFDSTIDQGKVFDANYTVENTGDLTGSQQISYNITYSGSEQDSNSNHRDLTLASGEVSSINQIRWSTPQSQTPGTYTLEVSSQNQTDTVNFDIDQVLRPDIVVNSIDYPSEAVASNNYNFSVQVENQGSLQTTSTVNLSLNSDQKGSKSVQLDPSETQTLKFDNKAVPDTSGTYNIEAESLNDTLTNQIDVVNTPIFAVTILNTYQDDGAETFTVEAEFENTHTTVTDQQTVKADVSGDWSWSSPETAQIQLDPGEVQIVNFTGNLESGSVTAEAWSERWEIDSTSEAYDDTSAKGPGFFFVIIFVITIMIAYMRGGRNDF